MELGFQELLVIGILLLVFFGPKKLPELGSGLGTAIRDFKRALSDKTSDVQKQARDEDRDTTPASVQNPLAAPEEPQRTLPVTKEHV